VKGFRMKFSRIGLGTVQFGCPYGIGNTSGQVPYDEVRRILLSGASQGVSFLDTSRAYGTSEDVLGRILGEQKLRESYAVCTKLDLPGGYERMEREELSLAAMQSFEESRRALRLDVIPLYLLHRYAYKTAGDGAVWDLLLEQQARGNIGMLGVSVSEGPDEARRCLQDPSVQALQVPYNVFDQRWRVSGVLQACSERGVKVISRSVYLQGLLLMDAQEARNKVPVSARYLSSVHAIAGQWGLSVKELAFRYVLGAADIASSLIGVDTLTQFEENMALFAKGVLEAELVEQIERAFAETPLDLVTPSLWELS